MTSEFQTIGVKPQLLDYLDHQIYHISKELARRLASDRIDLVELFIII
jgi:hypothetical protein